MAENFIGREYVEITYLVDGLTHKHGFSFNLDTVPSPGASYNSLAAQTKDGTGENFAIWLDAYINLLKPLFNTSTQFREAIVYTVAPNSNVKTFIVAETLSAVGTNAAAYRPAGQEIWSFRSAEGGIAKLVFMESVAQGNLQDSIGSFGAGTLADYRDYVLGDNSIILARDTSYLISGINRSKSENEAIFRRRFRN